MNFGRLKDKNRKENNFQVRKNQCKGNGPQSILNILSPQFLITNEVQLMQAHCIVIPKIQNLPVK